MTFEYVLDVLDLKLYSQLNLIGLYTIFVLPGLGE